MGFKDMHQELKYILKANKRNPTENKKANEFQE